MGTRGVLQTTYTGQFSGTVEIIGKKPVVLGPHKFGHFNEEVAFPPRGVVAQRPPPLGGNAILYNFRFQNFFPQMPGINTFLSNECNPCSDAACIH